jgi:hypothetical protein
MRPGQRVNRLFTYTAVKKSLFTAAFKLPFYTVLLRGASFSRISSPPPPSPLRILRASTNNRIVQKLKFPQAKQDLANKRHLKAGGR